MSLAQCASNHKVDIKFDHSFTLLTIPGIRNYEKESGRADHLNTCRISPYIHFGQVSPRTILTEARHMKSQKFLRKLAWRDMSYWLLTLWPDLPSVPTRVHYRVCRWSRLTTFSSGKLRIFSYLSVLTFVLGAQKNRLIQGFFEYPQHMFWLRNYKNIF